MAEDAPMDLSSMMGLRHGQNKVYTHTFNPEPDGEPQVKGVTDWKFSVDDEGCICQDLSFDTPENAEAALEFFRSRGYEVD